MIDTHLHLDYLEAMPLDEMVEHCHQAGVSKMLTISVEPDNFQSVVDIATRFPHVYGTQGIHPHDAKKIQKDSLEVIERNLTTHPHKLKAVGEIGLDYHYDHSPRDVQKQVFIQHMELAAKLNLPVVIHSRDADEDMMEILSTHAKDLGIRGVVHSFTSGKELAETALDLGFYLGFNGIITFKSAENVRDILRLTPIDQILLETDAPFLTPVPHRGKENNASYLPFILKKIEEVKEQPGLESRLDENAEKLFRFSGSPL